MKKIGWGVILLILAFSITSCGNKEGNNDAKSVKKEEKIDLSKEPICGEWTVTVIGSNGQTASIADAFAQNAVSEMTVYDFKEDGKLVTSGEYGIGECNWGKDGEQYYIDINGEDKIDLSYSEDKLEYTYENATLIFEKGNITSEELLKAAGLWHVDEFQITGFRVEDIGNGFFKGIYTITNNSEKALIFEGISMKELNGENVIIGDYYSYNKHAMETELQPGQSLELEMTFQYADGISQIESANYRYKDGSGTMVEGEFSTPYTADIQ